MVHGLETLRRLNSRHPERKPPEPKRSHKRKVKQPENPLLALKRALNRPWTKEELGASQAGSNEPTQQFAAAARSGGQEGLRN